MATTWREITPELPTNDLCKTLAYFETHLGFSTVFHLPGAGYAKIERNERSLFLCQVAGSLEPRTCMVYVDDIEASYRELAAAGATIHAEPRLLSAGTTEFSIRVPDGHIFTFFH